MHTATPTEVAQLLAAPCDYRAAEDYLDHRENHVAEHLVKLTDAVNILNYHERYTASAIVFNELSEIAREAGTPTSREPVDRDRAKWDAIDARNREKLAVDAACTRSPMVYPESRKPLAYHKANLIKFLTEKKSARRPEILAGTDIPAGSLSAILSSEEFTQTARGDWSLSIQANQPVGRESFREHVDAVSLEALAAKYPAVAELLREREEVRQVAQGVAKSLVAEADAVTSDCGPGAIERILNLAGALRKVTKGGA